MPLLRPSCHDRNVAADPTVGTGGVSDAEAVVARHRADGPEPDLDRAVRAVIDALGPGDVIAYGEVAAEAGWPGRARAVGRILSGSDGTLPWWRVVAASGRLVPGHESDQADRLETEGVAVDRARGTVRAAGRGPRRHPAD